MLTIFTTPKDFIGEFNIIQYNALNSWRALSQEIEIILIGDSLGTSEAAKSIKAKHIKDVEQSSKGTPTLSGLFQIAQETAQNNILCYVNADIIMPESILDVINALQARKGKFMAVGYRWDLDVTDSVHFIDDEVRTNFWSEANKNTQKHACTGIDYFIFRKGTFQYLPRLAIGRFGWDNWLLWKSRRMRIPLIDVSDEIFAIHQNHSYEFKEFKEKSDIISGSEGQNNQKITDGNTLNLLDANYYMVNGKIEKKQSKEYINRNLGKLPTIFPEFSFPLNLYKKFYRKYFL